MSPHHSSRKNILLIYSFYNKPNNISGLTFSMSLMFLHLKKLFVQSHTHPLSRSSIDESNGFGLFDSVKEKSGDLTVLIIF
jgi:hypothetical protein